MKKILGYIIMMSLTNCKSQSLDISKIEFDKPASVYNLEKLESYSKEITTIKSNLQDALNVTTYVFMGAKFTEQFNYNEIPIDVNSGVSFIVCNDQFIYSELSVDSKSQLAIIDILKEKLGKPLKIVIHERLTKDIDKNIESLLLNKITCKYIYRLTNKKNIISTNNYLVKG